MGDFVAHISTFDADTPANSQNRYSITSEGDQYFNIDPVSGNITVAKLLDREKVSELG